MTKRDKTSVDYSKGKLSEHCGPMFRGDKNYCRHYIASTDRVGTCELVSGLINPDFWCKLYDRVKSS